MPLRAALACLLLVAACSDGGARSEPATSTTADPTTSTSTTLPVGRPGAAGIGDPLFPGAGNGGYDVERYDLTFDVTDPGGRVAAMAEITATATQSLSSFHLDLSGFEIGGVAVDGEAATYRRDFDELVIEPPTVIPEGDGFTVDVAYRGTPTTFADPTAPITIGWQRAPSGTFAAMEPVGARTMFPANDHPADKARFEITVRAPDGETVLANGTEVDRRDDGPAEIRTFSMDQPMAPYLVQVAVGDYAVAEADGPGGVALRSATVPNSGVTPQQLNASAARQLPWFTERFGPYPFDVYGLLVADSPPDAALETQTLSIFPAAWFSAGIEPVDSIAAHELAHQWFGDHVALRRWSDIWLKEGLATYIQWMWEDHMGTIALDQRVADALGQAAAWRKQFGPVGDPDVAGMYSDNVYDGGALVFAALRARVGDDTFFRILRRWVETYGGGSASSTDFETLAAEVSGRDLEPFFDAWLRSTTLPALGG